MSYFGSTGFQAVDISEWHFQIKSIASISICASPKIPFVSSNLFGAVAAHFPHIMIANVAYWKKHFQFFKSRFWTFVYFSQHFFYKPNKQIFVAILNRFLAVEKAAVVCQMIDFFLYSEFHIVIALFLFDFLFVLKNCVVPILIRMYTCALVIVRLCYFPATYSRFLRFTRSDISSTSSKINSIHFTTSSIVLERRCPPLPRLGDQRT